jgi:hypothetical protein
MANTTAGLTASWSDIWLLDGVRTPFADYNGALAAVSPTDLGIKAGREASGVVRNAWDVEKELASSIKTLAIMQKDSAALAQTHTTRICRLRFRLQDASGRTVVYDRIFEIEGGKASPIDSRSEYEQPEYDAAVAVFGN